MIEVLAFILGGLFAKVLPRFDDLVSAWISKAEKNEN